MLKKSGVLIILLAFIIQGFYSPFLVVDYYINTALYQKNCINKAKAWLHCNGQCQLMKKLAEQEKKDQESNEMKTGKNEYCLSSKSFFSSAPFPKVNYIKREYIRFLCVETEGNLPSIFHPPGSSIDFSL